MTGRHDIEIAFVVPGCARPGPNGVEVTSRVGPFIEGVAERVRATTIVAYEPPPQPLIEDRTDALVRSAAGDLRFVSLGPRGSARTWPVRRRRAVAAMTEVSRTADVVVFNLVNRRAGLCLNPCRDHRIVAQIGGFTPEVVLATPMPRWRKPLAIAMSLVAEVGYWRIGRRAGLFLANGEQLVARYRRWIPHVDLLRTSARRAGATHHADDRMLEPRSPRLLLLGRVARAKGIFEAVDCLAELRSTDCPGARLDVVGDGPDLPALRQHAERLGLREAITFHGWVGPGPSLSGIVAGCDVLLLPTHAESLPKVIWEAQAHSVMVISSAVGSIPQAFRHEEDILLVPSTDPHVLADAVRRLTLEPELRSRLLANGRVGAAAVTVEAVADEFLAKLLSTWPELDRTDGT